VCKECSVGGISRIGGIRSLGQEDEKHLAEDKWQFV